MADPSVIVIGAGVAGLAAGCYARMNGYRCQILEHHGAPGGVVASWRREGYTIDGGIHWLMSYRAGTAAHALYREVGILPAVQVVEAPQFMQVLDEPSGRAITIDKDLDRFAARLAQLVPADDLALIRPLIAGARALQGQDLLETLRPRELSGRLGELRAVWALRGQLRYLVGRYGRPVLEYAARAGDPFLRQVLQVFYLPEAPVWFVMLLLSLLADGQLGVLPAGSSALPRAMARRYAALGGAIHFDARVEQILVERDRAVGVRLADGSEQRADAVISAADGHSTIFELLGGRYTDRQIEARYAGWDLVRPLVLVAFGVARDLAAQPRLSAIRLARPLELGGERVEHLTLRACSSGGWGDPDGGAEAPAPPGHGVLQASFESTWEHWAGLQRDPPAYAAQKQAVAREILDRLAAHFPGLAQQVRMQDVATPYTTWRLTRNRRGAWQGWLPRPAALQSTLERTLPGLQGLCLAGQWVMPGGGVPTCILSGKQAVQILCKKARRPFRASSD